LRILPHGERLDNECVSLNTYLVVWYFQVCLAVLYHYLQVVKVTQNSLNNRFIPYDVIDTDAVFAIDDDVEMRHDEILLAFRYSQESFYTLLFF